MNLANLDECGLFVETTDCSGQFLPGSLVVRSRPSYFQRHGAFFSRGVRQRHDLQRRGRLALPPIVLEVENEGSCFLF